jgi:CRISPR-associated exonuclease Cas4
MDDDTNLLPISALQHLAYCPRQCALIHVERLWSENALTAEGRVLHTRQDEAGFETRGGVRTIRSVRVFSRKLGLYGVCDSVEIATIGGRERYTPVETKHGRPKRDRIDAVQLCAQVLCLEEMHNTTIDEAFLFYGQTRRRLAVAIDDSLRRETLAMIVRVRKMMDRRETPKPEYGPKCRACSLAEECVPKALWQGGAAQYVRRIFREE